MFIFHMCAKSLQSCPNLCDPMHCSPPGSVVHGVLQERMLEWLLCLPPGDLPNLGIKPMSPALKADSLPLEPPGKPCVLYTHVLFHGIHVSYFGLLIWRAELLEHIEGREEEGDRGWDGWIASLTQWTWIWANSGRQWRIRKPGMLQSMGLQRAGQNLAPEQQKWRDHVLFHILLYPQHGVEYLAQSGLLLLVS